jgi:hypothetical protein
MISKAFKSPDRTAWEKFTEPKPKEVPCPEYVAFCVGCGTMMTKDKLEIMKKIKRCPNTNCRWMLFRLNLPGAFEEWKMQNKIIDGG